MGSQKASSNASVAIVAVPRTRWLINKGVLLPVSFLVAALAFVSIDSHTTVGKNWALEITVICGVWLAMFLLSSYAYFGGAFVFSNFYVALIIVFHLSFPIANTFGWDAAVYWSPPGEVWLDLSGRFVLLSLGCFGIGFALSLRRTREESVDPGRAVTAVRNRAFSDGIAMLVASLLFLGMTLIVVGNILAYTRADFFTNIGDIRGLGVFWMVFPSAVVLLVLGATRRRQIWFTAIGGLVSFLLVMLSGYRSLALYPMIVGAIVWKKMGGNIPVPALAAALGVMAFGIPFVGELRQLGPYNRIDSWAIARSIEDMSLDDTILLGATGEMLAHVIRLVPQVDAHRYGMSYIDALRVSIPNITDQQRESAREKAMRRGGFKGQDVVEKLSPSEWLTYRVAPWAADTGGGVGFTIIGEAYLNFGLIGVIAFFLLMGFALGKLDQVNLVQHPAWFLFASVFLWNLMATVRDDFANFVKRSVFTLLILFAWRTLRWVFVIRGHVI